MSSYIKTGINTAYLGIKTADKHLVKGTKDHYGLNIQVGKVELLSGKDEGSELLDKVVEANQFVRIHTAAVLAPKVYQTFVSVNPALLLLGQVSYNAIVNPSEQLVLTLRAAKRVDLKELSHLVTVYQLV